VSGRLVGILLLGAALLAGGGLYYLEQFHWYQVRQGAGEAVTLTATDGTVFAIETRGLAIAEGTSSPLKYRACFETRADPADLAARALPYDDPEPTVAPRIFPCFDADALAGLLDAGDAVALLGQADVTYGIDRVVAVTAEGQGYAWHQINPCGARVFDGDPSPEGCPPPPADLQ